ncbi:hypothetical protein [Hyphomicrobium sp. LHD-15]|uniref:hypothetical protein n=1 Tax=Hyphomicrobium sp. LHD-15 TaxID=3072142 RepID=UPI00280DAFE7|nr:hypothetical protein [Hyphomicrobium sp. LHD-15]MDQ8699265.1 hypothetical protein [Hyphomicrobium sp. LHD-15]
MSKNHAPADKPSSEPEQDITPAERRTLFQDTLKGLQDAFSQTDEDDTDTTTELHQNAAEAVSTPLEGSE